MLETYFGHIKTTQDALLIFEACRMGMLPRAQKRLSEKERGAVRSGAVFVWDEKEASMRRWTDGRHWSPSRVSGNFLSYRELEAKRRDTEDNSICPARPTFAFKADGLIKQSYSVNTVDNRRLHLICYYSRKDVLNHRLPVPTKDERLSSITVPVGYYLDSTGAAPSDQPAAQQPDLPPQQSPPHRRSSMPYPSQAFAPPNEPQPHPPLLHHHPHPHPHPHPLHQPPQPFQHPPQHLHPQGRPLVVSQSAPAHANPHSYHPTPATPPQMTLSPSSSSEDDERNGGLYALSAASEMLSHASVPPLSNTNGNLGLPTNTNVSGAIPLPSDPVGYGHPRILPPPQDIPWSKAKNSEDARQLNLIYSELRL
ncbi:uncharacterized protein VTP21DRAFT_8265 [Calcarisporiella thermophila]|uniref:uncharacterized protein n=1 Tax=Calcarisporiella thermophila TaxID=911321 RepID=UPI0037421BF0